MRLVIAACCLLGLSSTVFADEPPLVEKYLISGDLAKGEAAARKALEKNPKDDQARFGLGTIQFLRAVERMSQNMYRYGVGRPNSLRSLIGTRLNLPFAPNPEPRTVRYADVRAGLQLWIDDLAEAEATLAKIQDESVKLPLHFGQIRLDFVGDGESGGELWKVYAELNRAAQGVSAEGAKSFVIAFDRGDVAWLRGYCHLLMAMTEVALAYDGKVLFDRCGQLLFAKTDSPFLGKLGEAPRGVNDFDTAEILDFIAAIHLINMPVIEPKRMTAALKHMEQVVALSRESWKFIQAETDNDHEWVPNPKQDTVMPNGKVTQEMIQGWMSFLDETDQILAGKRLIPFWRGKSGLGVNLNKVFTEPRDFDLVLWVQGSAAIPYLEEGSKTTGDTWRRLQRLFQGEFIGFAFWFN